MHTNKTTRTAQLFDRLAQIGISLAEADTLRRAQLTLRRWHELECGDSNNFASWAIGRDEKTGKPYMVTYPHAGNVRKHRIADREAGALKRIKAIMAAHPDLWFYQQGDLRGCALYVGRLADVAGADLQSVYSRGIAVCV
jgi:hypothetical protein